MRRPTFTEELTDKGQWELAAWIVGFHQGCDGEGLRHSRGCWNGDCTATELIDYLGARCNACILGKHPHDIYSGRCNESTSISDQCICGMTY